MWIPNSVTFGLRHENIFGFLGRAGDILDAVRRAEGSRAIPSNLFSKVQWPNQVTARMLNNKETLTVDFSIEGVILTVDLDDLSWSRDRVRELFLNLIGIALPISGGDQSVNRIGTIDNYVIAHRSPGETALTTLTTLRGLGEGSDFTLRASFRSPTAQGLVRGGLEDWRNTILQVATRKQEERSERPDTLRVSIDYQTYFVPERRYTPGLIRDHFDLFLQHIETLHQGPLAGLQSEDRTTPHAR